MRLIRATLIQSLEEFWAALEPYLMPLVSQYQASGATTEDALRYVIAEELELVYLLFDVDHQSQRGRSPYAEIYAQLRSVMPGELSRVFTQWIVAPQIYAGELQVTLRIAGFDLYLMYWHSQQTAPIIAHYPITTHESLPSHPRTDLRCSPSW